MYGGKETPVVEPLITQENHHTKEPQSNKEQWENNYRRVNHLISRERLK